MNTKITDENMEMILQSLSDNELDKLLMILSKLTRDFASNKDYLIEVPKYSITRILETIISAERVQAIRDSIRKSGGEIPTLPEDYEERMLQLELNALVYNHLTKKVFK